MVLRIDLCLVPYPFASHHQTYHAVNMKVTRILNNDQNTALVITNLHGECDIF